MKLLNLNTNFQAGCRGFESRLPLQLRKEGALSPISLDSTPKQGVEIPIK